MTPSSSAPRTPTRRQALASMAGAAVALGATQLPAAAEPVTSRARALARRMTLEQQVGQLFVLEVAGRDAYEITDAAKAVNRARYGVDTPAEVVRKYQPGGVIYFVARSDDNMGDPRQIARLSNGLQEVAAGLPGATPLIISTDQEGGLVFRLPTPPATEQPGHMALGATWSPADAYRSHQIIGSELRACGITANYGPVADVNVNAANPVIGIRSFGAEPGAVAALVRASVEGLHRGGVAATAKHFPGHGDTDTDSHFGLPRITHSRAQLDAIDLPPFRAAIDAGIETIMTAHIVVPSLDPTLVPATMSRPILTGLLREELGFEGLIVTDALDMQGASAEYPPDVAAVTAFGAGADMLVLSPNLPLAYGALLAAVRSGEISAARVEESVVRILSHKIRRGLYQDPGVSENRAVKVVGNAEFLADADAITGRSTTLVKNDGGLLPLAAGRRVLVTGWGVATVANLAAGFTAAGHTASSLETGAVPTQAKIAAAVAAAGDADVVVVSSNILAAGGTEKGVAQVALVNALLATGKPVVGLGVRLPYDIARFPAVPAYVATYGYGLTNLRHGVQVITGELSPGGRLPVAITAAGDPTAVLYPIGHGMGL
ncbi:Beta-hexosaminidase [Streptomyces sp. RB5]|uniref:beta-N-acetylhexosaminidase n=1 Tax=Streptomyces smaragdinus TaxID=2585196 RepID=A0A7K0CR90_9ACTN|nr:glycoside hydrolase family 3 protein [Streptomyces smaragdinus]MQY15853.1 Beta-hexosaminidase [Streptomyces smaragdinus]